MRIGLLSDTHGYLDERIAYYLKGCDEIWHAGDFGPEVSDELRKLGPLIGVYGNIDGQAVRLEHPEWQLFEREGLRIFMMHIAGYPGRYTAKAREHILAKTPDVVVVGHSHILKAVKDSSNGHLHLNPGAAGRSGFHKLRTLMLLELKLGKVADLKVVELGPKSQKTIV